MKPHLIYYVATSLDGFIARPDGSVDWLDRFAEGGNDHGYNGFYQGIDGLLMGRGTYEIVRGFGDWPYPGKPCQVLTRNPRESAVEGVELRHDTPQEGLARLGEQGCRRRAAAE